MRFEASTGVPRRMTHSVAAEIDCARNCDDCAHVWFAGERQHAYADVEAASPEDSDVLCTLCRRQREKSTRDETKRWSGWEPPFS